MLRQWSCLVLLGVEVLAVCSIRDGVVGPEHTASVKFRQQKVDDIMNMDKDDESLRKWKESMLGNASAQGFSPKDDPRRAVITEMIIQCEGRPDIKYAFDSKEQVEKLKDQPFTLKEACNYRIVLRFRVQHELVTGLKHINTVYRKGIKVDKEETMIGSYRPQKEPHEVIIPRKGWDEAPKGMLARGKYKANSKFVDDDGQNHLEYDYTFAIKKDWDTKEDDDE